MQTFLLLPFYLLFFFFSLQLCSNICTPTCACSEPVFLCPAFCFAFWIFFLVFERIILFYYLIILYINYTKYFFVEIFLGEKKKSDEQLNKKEKKGKSPAVIIWELIAFVLDCRISVWNFCSWNFLEKKNQRHEMLASHLEKRHWFALWKQNEQIGGRSLQHFTLQERKKKKQETNVAINYNDCQKCSAINLFQ